MLLPGNIFGRTIVGQGFLSKTQTPHTEIKTTLEGMAIVSQWYSLFLRTASLFTNPSLFMGKFWTCLFGKTLKTHTPPNPQPHPLYKGETLWEPLFGKQIINVYASKLLALPSYIVIFQISAHIFLKPDVLFQVANITKTKLNHLFLVMKF